MHAGWQESKQGKCRDCKRYARETKPCSACGEELPLAHCFTPRMWWSNDDIRKCNACKDKEIEKKPCAGVCGQIMEKTGNFSDWQWTQSDRARKCYRCCEVERKAKRPGWWKCIQCKKEKNKDSEFDLWLANRTRKVPDGKQRCNECKLEQNMAGQNIAKMNLKCVQTYEE